MEEKHKTDIVIIGAGPVGLFAIFECGMLKMKCHVVDTLNFTGGQCTALYPEKPIYDIPGYPSIDAVDLIEKLEEQAKPFDPIYHLGQQVTSVTKITSSSCGLTAGSRKEELDSVIKSQGDNKGWKVKTSKGVEIECKAIIISAGCGAFGPNRPPIERLEEFEKSGSVAYMVRRKEDYRNKRVVIAGGGDSAVDWVLSLAGLAEHIYVVHRRDKFRAAPENVDKMKKLEQEGKVEMVIPYQLSSLKGDNGKLEAVMVKDLDGGEKELKADALLPFYGLAMELGPIAEWGLNIHNKHIKVDHASCATNIEGIYAIGDINDYSGKLKLIVCGFSEAAMAAHSAYPIVHKGQVLHFEYSTTKGTPGN